MPAIAGGSTGGSKNGSDLVKFSHIFQLCHRALKLKERVCLGVRNTARDSSFHQKSNRTVLSDFPMPDSPVARRPRLHPIWDLVEFSTKIQLLHRALRPEERVRPDVRNTLRDSRFDQKIQPVEPTPHVGNVLRDSHFFELRVSDLGLCRFFTHFSTLPQSSQS